MQNQSRAIKNIIRHHEPTENQKFPNIFKACSSARSPFDSNTTFYSLVGDLEFKKKYLQDQKKDRQIQSNNEPVKEENESTHEKSLNNTYCQYTRTIDDGSLRWMLPLNKQLQLTRHNRTFAQIRRNEERDEKINVHLKKRLSHFGMRPVNNTITFEKQQIQVVPNPELIDLINDNIPQYWKNSLRDNEKRLKRHVKGNTFKPQIAEEMLQTLKGRKTLMSSIPKVKQDFLSPVCSRTQPKQRTKYTLSLKGRSPLKSQRSESLQKSITPGLPEARFDQTYRTNYSSTYRWMVSQLC